MSVGNDGLPMGLSYTPEHKHGTVFMSFVVRLLCIRFQLIEI